MITKITTYERWLSFGKLVGFEDVPLNSKRCSINRDEGLR
jgi:hypothetical protein